MNVLKDLIIALQTQTVLILRVLLTVNVKLDTLEMDTLAKVDLGERNLAFIYYKNIPLTHVTVLI